MAYVHLGLSLFISAPSFVTPPPPSKMAFMAGKWSLVSSDNFDAYLKAIGGFSGLVVD